MKKIFVIVIFLIFQLQSIAQILIPVKSSKYAEGCITDKGEWVVENVKKVDLLENGFAIASTFDLKQILFNQFGKQIIKANSIRPFSDGLSAVENNLGQWGFINESGILVIPYKSWIVVEDFHDGYAVVRQNGVLSIINMEGNIVYTSQYSAKEIKYGDSRTLIRYSDCVELLDANFKLIKKFDVRNVQLRRFSDGCGAIGVEVYNQDYSYKWRVIDFDGNTIVDGLWDVGTFSNGVTFAAEDYLYGYIDKRGKWIGEPMFNIVDTIPPYFHEGLAFVETGMGMPHVGFINLKGEFAIERYYLFAYPFSDGLALVGKGGEFIGDPYEFLYIDKSGKVVIDIEEIDEAGSFHNGIAPIYKNNKLHIINKNGQIIRTIGN